jgi:TRAP-type C4-dicarboxylate transport system permease small subunit
MFTRVAENMKKGLSYPGKVLSVTAMVAMVFVMLAVTVDVFMRYVFNSPIRGVWDLCTLGFAIIVWGPMTMAALKGSHIVLTFLLDRFPRLLSLGLQLIISLVVSGMLGMVSWRLFIHAMLVGATKVMTPTLRIAYEPFVYFTAVACAIMALAFLANFPEAIGKIRKEQ